MLNDKPLFSPGFYLSIGLILFAVLNNLFITNVGADEPTRRLINSELSKPEHSGAQCRADKYREWERDLSVAQKRYGKFDQAVSDFQKQYDELAS